MRTTSLLNCLVAVLAVLAAGSAAAGSVSVSSTAPPVDSADIANDNGAADAGGDQGHLWSDRPHQGQTFVTGSYSGGYQLNAVTLKNRNNTITNSPTFNVVVGTVSGTTLTQVGSTETAVAPGYAPLDYITFVFDTPLTLAADTAYGFLWGSAGSGFVTVNNLDGGTYGGGTAISSGDNNVPDLANVIDRGVDRVFHLDLDPVITNDDDGDGLPNQWESDNSLDPNDDGTLGESAPGMKDGPNGALGDPDADGSNNKREFRQDSDPQDDDSDDDNLLDGVETGTSVFIDENDTGSNPNLKDTDGDSLQDDSEVAANPHVTDPSKPDTDGDGVGDADELAADPFVTDPTEPDTDGDGYDDGTELARGGDPTDPDSLPDAVLMAVSGVAPPVDGADISSLSGLTDIGGDQGHVWANRSRQGQSFTTGTAAGGYKLHAITVRVQVTQPSTLAPNWELRVGTLDGSEVFTPLATYSVAGATIPQSDAANGFPSHVTWSFGVPFTLAPDTTYGFDIYAGGSGYISLGEPTDVFPGGSAYSAGSPGSALYPASPPDPVTSHGNDRHFHLDITGGGPSIRIRHFETFDDGGGESIRLAWESVPGKKYAVDSSLDLLDWSSEVASGIEAVAGTTTFEELIANLPQAGPGVFFRVRELVPPPPLSADFEAGPAGWTAGTDGAASTQWALGAPANTGPPTAHSPDNCWGTNMTADYADSADCWLRSPDFDLAGAPAATLSWFQWVDVDFADSGAVRILDAADDTELGVLESGITGLEDAWTRITRSLPATALGKLVYLEFRFRSNDDAFVYPGWYIDDVMVTVP